MKLLIDANNIIYASFFVNLNINKSEISPGMVYHLFLSKLIYFKRKFNLNNQDIIIAFDHKISWRKKVFEYYKQRRKEEKEKTDIDYKALYDIIDNLYVFLINSCSFITLREENLEADDWIGILCNYFQDNIVIISTDKDFYQCCSDRVKLFNHVKGKFIGINNSRLELMIKVLTGDKGDGIPNILSDSDTFVTSKRQKPLGEKKILKLIKDNSLKQFIIDNKCEDKYKRNLNLISFNKIPEYIKKIAIEKVKNYMVKYDKMKVMSFLFGNNLNVIAGNKDLLLD